MVHVRNLAGLSASISGQASTKSALRRNLRSQASRLSLRSTIGIAAAAGVTLLVPGQAWADCLVGAVTVQCDSTVTTDTTFPANPPVDRHYQGLLPTPIIVTVDPGATVSGNGLAFTNTGTGGVTVTNNHVIVVDNVNTPTAGGTAALSVSAAGGPISYTGGSILNNGNGNAFDAVQTGGVGSVNINVTGDVIAAAGEGITVRDVATSTGISVTTGNVTALTAGKDAIDAQSQSLTGNITEVANGNLQAGNAGMVAAILNAAATGNIDVTANGSIDARFGIDAENFGSGSTGVTTIGPVNVTTGNGIFALSTGGNVIVNAGDVTSTSNTAVIAQQTKVAGAGLVGVTVGNVSGTTGVDAHNFGTGDIGIVANGTVTGTAAEGIKATGNAGVFISVANTVTGATRGLSLVGGTGGGGEIFVTGSGGFVGGTGDAANILNNGSGGVTVNISGASSSAGGEGFIVRDTAVGGNISVTTGAVTALTAGKDTIDVQSQSTTANITEVANGNLQAGNAAMVAAILNAAGTGNINVTANGSIDARFGIDAENFGSGSTSVTTVGPVNVTTGNGIFALSTGGDVTVNAGDVTSTSNTAIIAQQTKVAGTGSVIVGTTGNVSGTTGIDAHNFGTGLVGVVAGGTVTGTAAEGIKATGNAGVTVTAFDTVTGATRGLSLVGGTGGAGDILVNGPGGFVGGTGDAANILNNGSGTVTVDIGGASSSAGGEGFIVRDTAAGGNISVTTGAVTALTAGKDTIDVQSQSLTANITEVANGNLQAGNAAMVAAILNAAGTGNIDVTANGSIDARFGIDAENFGSGSTSVTTVGPVNVTTGNGIFALSTGGDVTVNAGDVTSTSNTAIIAQQTKVAGTGSVIVGTTGNVSGTTGIDAHNFGTGLVGVIAGGTVTGTFAEGIKATGNAGVTVTAFDTVTGATRGLSLVGGTGGAGDILVDGPGGFVGGTGDAANILNNGSGTVTVDIGGASSSAGGEGFVVRDTAAGGNISVTTGAVTALTAGKDAIDVQSQSLTANVTEVANGNIQAGNAGMVAAILNAAATGNIDVTANGSMDARFGVDAENFGSGSTSVTTVGPVNVTTGNGIFALSTGGNVTVNAGDVTSTGNTAIIAQQTKVAGAGDVNVTAGNVSGTTGIDAHNFGTGAVGILANGTVTGTAAEGIKAVGNAGVLVTVADTVTGATRGLSVIGGTGGTGDILVGGTGGFVGGTGDAANILNNGAGKVTVNIFGASSSTGGNGFIVRDTAIGGDIRVAAGDVTALTAGKNGIDVQSQSLTANVSEVANGNIQAGNAGMVAAILSAAATGNIDVTAIETIDARFGVDAENFGSGSTSVATVGPVNVTTGNGIFALTTGGNVTVNAGDVTSTGNTAIIAQQTKVAGAGNVDVTAGNVWGTTGIDAHNFGTGTVSVTANGTVTGTAAEGIKATGNDAVSVAVAGTVTGGTNGLSLVGGTGGAGNISVTGAGGFVGGTGDAANILNNGAGTVTVDITGASSSAGGNGFIVRDTAAGGDISVTTGAVTALTAGKNAIDVQSQSATANVTEVANGNIQAGNAGMVAAIFPAAATGNIDVTANGSIDARFGIDAENFGTGSTSVTTVGPVNVTTGNGIFALSTGGNVFVNAGDVTSTGNTAIIAQQTKVAGAGILDVTAGNVSGTTGIDAHNFGTGVIGIITTGTVTGTAAEGIKAIGNDAVSVAASQTVTGATRGLSLVGGTGGAGDIAVTGTGGFVGGTDDAANILNNGAGTVTVNVSGASSSTGGNGFIVRDTAAGGNIIVTTGAVTALTAGKNGIDVQTQSATANVTEVANGNIQAGNAGMVAAIFPAAATGNIDVTANGSIDARFGIDAENFGTGNTTVTTIGPINVTTGNGVFALTTGGDVTVNTNAVTSTGNTAIIAQQTNAAGNGSVGVGATTVWGTTGIDAHNFGTGGVGIVTTGFVTGTAAEGIKAIGNAGVFVVAGKTVTGATNGLTLVGGTGGAGDISVTGAGGFMGGTGDGANILNNGSGTVTVDISGASGSTGGNGIVVRDTAAGGNISVTTGAVTALTAGKNAIDVISASTAGNVAVVANGNVQAGNAGIVAALVNGTATGNIDVTANGSIDARFGVDAENFGSGSTSVTTVGPVNATTGNGIFALTTGGDVWVNAGAVTATGNTAIIAQQTSAAGSGAVNVTAGNVSGTTGIIANNVGSGAIGITANGWVTGTSAEGILATGNGAVSVAATNMVTGATRGLSVTGGTGGTGDIWVHGTGGFVGGTGDAANIANNGAGTVTYNVSGASSSTGGNGIVVGDTALGGGISITTGAVTALAAGKNAVYAVSASLTGNVTEVANGNIRAGNAGMVAAILPAAATGNVNVTTNGSVDARFGIDAENQGLGTTSVTTVGPVTATTGTGVYALSHGGNVTVTSGNVTSGGSVGIYAQQTAAAGAGTITVNANGSTGGTSGIIANNTGTGATTVTTVGPVTATTGNGILATSNGGNIKVTTGSVSSTGASAIAAQNTAIGANTGTIDVTQTAGSTVTANAAGAYGIWTNSGQSSGTTTINVNGTIHAGAAGIGSTSTTGNIVTNISTTGAIDPLIGIDQATVSGAISVNNAGLVQGDNIGVRLTSSGAGVAGALTVGQTSTGRISSVVGVDLSSVNAALIVSNAGQITATGAAIRMAATGTGTGAILNSGTITGGTNAVLATLNNTSFTLNNVGTINGSLNVSGSNVAASTVTNAGGAAMNFGSGASSVSGNFVNAGSATIGAGGSVLFAGNTTNSNRITFVGAGLFATNGAMINTGIINAQNNITSNVVSVGGNYTGGGQFFADYSTSTATADRLNITGTASGNTNVTMNLVGPRAFVAGGFLPVVTVTPGAAATAFTSNTVFPTTGLILESFGQNPSSNKQFGLIQTINPEAASLGSLSYVAEAASATLDDPISPYLSERANPPAGAKRFSLWMRGAGGHTRETVTSTITGGGVTVSGSNEVRTEHMALTFGGDLGLLNLGGGGWNVHVGVLGGWYNGRAQLSSTEQLRVETPFLGGYVAVGNGAFQLDGTLRREWRHYKVVLPVLFGPGAPQKLDGSATAGSVHASYRFGGKTGFAMTPFLGFNYADSSIDSLPIDAISAYLPGGDKTETGEGGLRISYRGGSDAKVVIEPFASASYLKNWSRGDSAVFSFGTPVTNFALATSTWDDAVRYSVGVTAKAHDGRVTGFLVGNINDGDGLHSFSLNAGVRFNF